MTKLVGTSICRGGNASIPANRIYICLIATHNGYKQAAKGMEIRGLQHSLRLKSEIENYKLYSALKDNIKSKL